MLIAFAAQQSGKTPSRLDIADLDAQAVGAFLNHLETGRGNSVRTRNARLAAIRSLFGYAALRHPEHAAAIARVLAIPPKRYDKTLITYLTEDEITALLAAPDPDTWTGRRDQALLMLACQTGLRATELTSLTIGDAHLRAGAHVSCWARAASSASPPLTPATVTVLRGWFAERGGLLAVPSFDQQDLPVDADRAPTAMSRLCSVALNPPLSSRRIITPRPPVVITGDQFAAN